MADNEDELVDYDEEEVRLPCVGHFDVAGCDRSNPLGPRRILRVFVLGL